MHLSSRGEDALDARRGGRSCKVLLDHLPERRPLAALHLPPVEDGVVNVGHVGVCEVLLQLVNLRRLLLRLFLQLDFAEEGLPRG
jgi:hypothetical protein